MGNYIKSVENAYKKRREFILIALTGRTGVGCSTAASILKTKVTVQSKAQMGLDCANSRK